MSIIEVNHVTKEYQLGQLQSLKTTALNQWRRLTGQPVEERAPFKALDDVNFNIEAGEVVGIIGHNGAGKSTMLKLLANISKPSSGSITVKGKVAPLIEVGAGLVGDLTGRENIYLNGAILGIPKAKITRKFDDIVAFAELEEFIDTPIKRYSSGMQVRLGFSIATSVESDILIVDEVLAVGDLAFQRKCFDRMEDLIKRQGKTVLLVSHNIRQVERLCSRVILLGKGEIIADGRPADVCDLFYEYSDSKIHTQITQSAQTAKQNQVSSGEMELDGLFLQDDSGNTITTVKHLTDINVIVDFHLREPLDQLTFGIGIHTTDFLYLSTHNSERELPKINLPAGHHRIRCAIRKVPLQPGVFSLRLGVTASEVTRTVFYAENLLSFQVLPPDGLHQSTTMRDGFFALDARWILPSELPATL
jgi:lipopolysaccharide transport system ATP-binding protein